MNKISLLLKSVVVIVLIGCASLPESYNTGKQDFENKNYESAVKNLEIAHKKNPGSNKVTQLLLDAKTEYAKYLINKEKKLDSFDLLTRIKLLSQSKKELEDIISSTDSKNLNKIKQMFQSNSKKLSDLTSQKNIIGASTRGLADKSQVDPVKAFEQFNKYSPYSTFWTDISNIETKIKSTAVNYYSKKGLQLLNANKLNESYKLLKRGLEIEPQNKILLVAMNTVNAKKHLIKSEYRESFAKIKRALKLDPNFDPALNIKNKIKAKLFEDELLSAEKLINKKDIEPSLKVFAIYDYLLKEVVKNDATMSEIVTNKKSQLKSIIAKKLTDRASKLSNTNKYKFASLTLKLFRLANKFDSKHAEKFKEKASWAQAVSHKKKDLNILVFDKKTKKILEVDNLNQVIVDSLVKKLNAQKLPGVAVIKKEHLKTAKKLDISNALKNSPVSYQDAEIIIIHNVAKLEFTETGRNTPITKSSRYISGVRWVKNPSYDKAYGEWEIEKLSFEKATYKRQQALLACNQTSNVYERNLCRGSVKKVSSIALDSAKKNLNNIPREIPKKIISSYSYNFFSVKVTGLIAASYTIFDRRNNQMFTTEPFEITVNKEGQIYEGVEATDQNSLKNGHFNVPDIASEIDSAKKQVISQITTNATNRINDLYANRFCLEAKTLLKLKKITAAAESFEMCMDLGNITPNKKEFELAKKAIDSFIGITEDDINKYGYNSSTLVEQPKDNLNKRTPATVADDSNNSWPSDVTALSEKSLKEINKLLKFR